MMTTPSWDFSRSAAAARILVEVGEANGLARRDCLARTGLTADQLVDPAAEIEAGQELAIARNLVSRLGDRPGLGAEAGARYTLGTFGIWGFTMQTSPTVRDMARLGTHYAALSFAFIRPVYEEDDREGRVVYVDDDIPPDVRNFFVERELAKMLILAPTLLGGLPGFRVETRFEGARSLALQRLAPRADLRTGAARHLIVFDAALLDARMPQADRVTATALVAQCADLLERRQRRRGTSAHVRARLLAQLDDPPSMEDIARDLDIEERTLRRRLSADGTNYRELVDEVRSAMAEEFLGGGYLTVEEVSQRLGYNDAAAFSRAFTRWTGQRPGTYRGRAPASG